MYFDRMRGAMSDKSSDALRAKSDDAAGRKTRSPLGRRGGCAPALSLLGEMALPFGARRFAPARSGADDAIIEPPIAGH